VSSPGYGCYLSDGAISLRVRAASFRCHTSSTEYKFNAAIIARQSYEVLVLCPLGICVSQWYCDSFRYHTAAIVMMNENKPTPRVRHVDFIGSELTLYGVMVLCATCSLSKVCDKECVLILTQYEMAILSLLV